MAKKIYPIYNNFERCYEYKKSRRISLLVIGILFLLFLILNYTLFHLNIVDVAQANLYSAEPLEETNIMPPKEENKRKLVANLSDFIIYDNYIIKEKEVKKQEVKKKVVVKKEKVKKQEKKVVDTGLKTKSETTILGSESKNIEDVKNKAAAEIVYLMEKYKKYPKQARRLNAEGIANITFSISNTGIVSHVEITKTSGYDILDRAALNAAKKIIGYNAVKDNTYNNLLKVTVPVDFYLE